MKTLTFAAFLLVAAASQAQLIYDNGAPNGADGNEMTFWAQAEDITLGATQNVGMVRFWTIEDPGIGNDGTVEWALYADSGGPSGSPITGGIAGVTQVSTGNVVLGFYNEFYYDFNASFTLNAGTTYWLSLHMNPSENYANRDDIYWETTNSNGTAAGMENMNGNSSWTSNGNEHAFQLYGPVPEPASMLVLGVGALGLIRRRRNGK